MNPHLVRLLSLLSPSFPTGAFGYSYGLEAAFQTRALNDAEDLFEWIQSLAQYGSLRNDAILVAESWRAYPDQSRISIVEENAQAIAASSSRFKEQRSLGASFLTAVKAGYPLKTDMELPPLSLPVAVGAIFSSFETPLEDTLLAFAHTSVNGLIQAALRLAPIGQTKGVVLLAKLEPIIEALAADTIDATLDDLVTLTINADILSMQHEMLSSRIFLS